MSLDLNSGRVEEFLRSDDKEFHHFKVCSVEWGGQTVSTSLPSLQCRVGEKSGWGVDGDEGRARKEGVYRQVMEGGSAGTVVMWEGEWVRAERSWRVKVRPSLLRWPGMSQGWRAGRGWGLVGGGGGGGGVVCVQEDSAPVCVM